MTETPINEPLKVTFNLATTVLDSVFEMPLVTFEMLVENEVKNMAAGFKEQFYMHYRGPKPAPIQEEETTP